MSVLGKNILAVVPARGGSKSIVRKNMQILAGKSLIAHVGDLCSSINWIDHAVLSTDDEIMRQEGVEHGLSAPFLRPSDLATDKARSIDVWRHALVEAEEATGKCFDVSILLEPTSPLRRSEDLELTIRTLIETEARSAITVSPTPAHFTPHKTLEIGQENDLNFYHPDGAKHSIRQSIPDYVHRNGVCYAMPREVLMADGEIIGERCVPILILRPLVNIDEPFELEMAEWLLTRKNET